MSEANHINIILDFTHKLIRAIKRHGLAGFISVATGKVARFIETLHPSVRAEIKAHQQRAADFDLRYGIDTGGLIHPTKLGIDHPNQIHAVSYRGSDPALFQDAMALLPIVHDQFVFIDFGSGKGRVVFMAKAYPFKKIVGVEFSRQLHDIALNNLTAFCKQTSDCDNIEFICADALAYPLPEENLVCYFCNPFDAVVMSKMLENIKISQQKRPREIYIVYYNPKEATLLESSNAYKEIAAVGSVRIWKMLK